MSRPAPLACRCGKVPRRTVIRWIRRGATTVDALAAACGAGASCRSCHGLLLALLARHGPSGEAPRPRQLELFEPGGRG